MISRHPWRDSICFMLSFHARFVFSPVIRSGVGATIVHPPGRRHTEHVVRASVVEDRHVELAEALAVGHQVYFDDLPARDREAEYDTRPSARSPH
jgi:hypothetical protein